MQQPVLMRLHVLGESDLLTARESSANMLGILAIGDREGLAGQLHDDVDVAGRAVQGVRDLLDRQRSVQPGGRDAAVRDRRD